MSTKSYIEGLARLLPTMLLIAVFVLLIKRRHDNRDRTVNSVEVSAAVEPTEKSDSLFEFDPNTVDVRQMLALGLPRKTIGAISRRRASGFPFAVKEELLGLYGMTDSIYFLLEPYIIIDSQFMQKPKVQTIRRQYESRPKPVIRYRPFRIDTATVAYLSTIGFSERQARVIVDYRDKRGGFRTLSEFAECYVVDPQICDTLAHYMIFPEAEADTTSVGRIIEINTADSALLRTVRGIGEKSVVEILEYRRRLGGFYRLEQLAEVKSVTESNFEKILTQICCDSCNISKIDINFAPSEQLREHPYIAPKSLRKLLNRRQLKGGWSKIEEMIEDKIFDRMEAERLRPYLRFTDVPE